MKKQGKKGAASASSGSNMELRSDAKAKALEAEVRCLNATIPEKIQCDLLDRGRRHTDQR